MKKLPFSLDAIKAKVDEAKKQSIGVYSPSLAKEREQVIGYYEGRYPRPQSGRDSTFVSTTVYDAIESMKAQFSETFGTHRDIIQFVPQNANDIEMARIATEYTNYVVNRRNDIHTIYNTVWDDAFKSRVGIVKVYWDEVVDHEDFEQEGLSDIAVQMLLEDPNVDSLEVDDPDELTGLATVRFTKLSRTRSQVRIDNVCPEDFGIEAQAKCLKDAFHFHRVLKSRAQIAALGFNIKKLIDTKPDGDSGDGLSTTRDERYRNTAEGAQPYSRSGSDLYWLYECYIYLEKDSRRALYKVVQAGGVILDVEEVDRSPFVVFNPIPVGHDFWGVNFGTLSISVQDAITTIYRGALVQVMSSNYPLWRILKGQVINPDELLKPKLGGVVNVTHENAIAPMPQQQVPPAAFSLLEALTRSNEQTTGINSLGGGGLNKEALSTQNSQGLVQDLVDMSRTRQKAMARNFANNFMVPLYLEVYRLVIENEDQRMIREVSGNWVEIDPSTWAQRRDCDVHIDLTGSDAAAEAMKIMSLMQMGLQDADIARMTPPEKKYNAAVRIYGLNGIKNVGDYLVDPQQLPPPQPDPAAVAAEQAAAKQLEIEDKKATAALLKAQTDERHKMAQDEIASLKAQIESMRVQEDLLRKRLETENRVDIAQRETALAEEQAATGNDDVRYIVSPT